MTGAIESRQVQTVRCGSIVTRGIQGMTHRGRVIENTHTVGLGQQLIVFCTECNDRHTWTMSPSALIATQVPR